jgi:hypothetical protein
MTTQFVRTIVIGTVLAVGMWASNASSQSLQWQDMDPNHTGVVTADQHAAYAKTLFDRMDTNHDGKLTKAEWVAGLKSLSAERKQKNEALRAAALQKRSAVAAAKATATTPPGPSSTK